MADIFSFLKHDMYMVRFINQAPDVLDGADVFCVTYMNLTMKNDGYRPTSPRQTIFLSAFQKVLGTELT